MDSESREQAKNTRPESRLFPRPNARFHSAKLFSPKLISINRPRSALIRAENRNSVRFLRGETTRSSNIFFLHSCCVPTGQFFSKLGGRGSGEIAWIQTSFDLPPFSFIFPSDDDIGTTRRRKLPRLILVRKIQELADSGEIKSCHGIK